MKFLVISDLHYDRRVFRGVDESVAWGWLLDIVGFHRPDVLLCCGDWGTAISIEEFGELLRCTLVLSIYGNHERMDVLGGLWNTREPGLPVLMRDGEIYVLGGLRIAGVNGIVSPRDGVVGGVPRRTPEEFLRIASMLRGKRVDLLLMHETPCLPSLFPFMQETINCRTAFRAAEIVRPRILVNGHMHSGGYKTTILPWGTRYIYIDTSQQNRHYLTIQTRENQAIIQAWKDYHTIAKPITIELEYV